MEVRTLDWRVVAGIIALLVVLGVGAFLIFRPTAPAPLIDPELARRIKAEGQEVDRLYAQFQKDFPPEKLEQLKRAAENIQ